METSSKVHRRPANGRTGETVSFYLDARQVEQLVRLAERRLTSKSALVREAVAHYMAVHLPIEIDREKVA